MRISLNKPELEKFVSETVDAGNYASASEVIEAGLARLMLDPPPDKLDIEDIDDIRQALDEINRGQTLDWKKHSAELRAKYLSK